MNDEIVRSYVENDNATVKQLAKKFHRKPSTISKILRAGGIVPQRNRTRMIGDKERSEVMRLHLEGKTMPEIAAKVNVSHGSVCNIIHEYGGRIKQYKRRRTFKTKYTSDELLEALREYYNKTGIVPNHRGALKDKRLPSTVTYFKYFPGMSWPEILIEAGLDISQYFIARDGHIYDSSFEVEMANLLLDNEVKYEPHKKVCSNRRWTCDFYLPTTDLWLELDGLEDRRRDKSKLEEKLAYYKSHNYKYHVLTRDKDLISVLDI